MESMMRTWAVILACLLASPAAGAEAREEPCPRPQAGRDGDARARYRDGERLYAAGRYGESIAAFGAALERSGRPELYFDLANAHERMGHLASAAALLERYLRCARPADAGLVRERLRRLRSSAARLGWRTCPVAPGVVLDDVALGDGAIDDAGERSRSGSRAWPWLVAGGGAAAAAVGLAIAAGATALPPCAYPDQGRACVTRPIDASLALERAAIASAAAGAVAIGTGAVLLVRERRQARAVPLVGGGMIGVAIGGEL
jgi:tetratricopeptide (TPR) repeat protein